MVEEKTTPFCENCGGEIGRDAGICPTCGVGLQLPELKNPAVSAILSFLIPGLGQIYNGQIFKGAAFVFIAVFFLFTTIIAIGYFLYPVFWIYTVYDAYTTAKQINARATRPG